MKNMPLPHEHHTVAAAPKLREKLAQTADFQRTAEAFRQLGDASRLRIYWLLCHCEQCVINISALVQMSSPAVCHHLRQLKNSGLIVSRREGKEVYYKAADTEQSKLLHRAIERVLTIACPQE